MAEKQRIRIDKIIGYFGRAHVESYIRYFYPDAVMSALTNKQAQKIITGLGARLPKAPVMGVYLRDV